MRISDLRERFEFQAPTNTADGRGGVVRTYPTTAFTVWGAHWPLHGAEAVAAMQAGGVITGTVRIRYRTDAITTAWRIKWGDRYLDIVTPPIAVGGGRRWLEFKVKEAS